jgi:hypothetical protein
MPHEVRRPGVLPEALRELTRDLPPPKAKANGAAAAAVKAKPKPTVEPMAGTSALTLHRTPGKEVRFVISTILPAGLTLLCGRPKIGKSWLTLRLALDVAFGRSVLARFPVSEPGRVSYLALEESQNRTRDRLRRLAPVEDARLDNLSLFYAIKPLLAGGLQQLEAHVTDSKPDLVIVDTLLAILQAANGRDVLRSDYKEVTALRQLAERHEIALLVVHHLRKAGGDSIDRVAGTTGVTAGCDAIWTLTRGQQPGEALLEVTGREIEEQTFGLKFAAEPFGWSVIGSGDEVRLSEERREVLDLLRAEGPMTPIKIAVALRKNANSVRWLLLKLREEGHLTRDPKGGYCLA